MPSSKGWPALPVLVVARVDDLLVVVPAHQLPRARADRLAVVVLAQLLHRLRRRHHAGTVRQDQRQRGIGLTKRHGDLQRPGDLDLLDRAEIGLDARARIALVAVEVELHRLGVERRAVMEQHARADIHHQRLGVGELPGFGEARDGLQRRVLERHQRVVDRIEEGMVLTRASRRRVEARRIGRRRDLEDSALLLRPGPARGGQRHGAREHVAACRQVTCFSPFGDLAREVAGNEVARFGLLPVGLGGGADFLRERAAGAEAASGGWRDRARDLALQHDALGRAQVRRHGHRLGRQQRLGVGMERPLGDVVGRTQFHELAEIHDGDAVADVAHHAEVVGDEQIGESELALQVGEQVQHVGLDRHVERRHDLVAHHELGPQGQHAGDVHALLLAARQLVRVALGELGAQADAVEHRDPPASLPRSRPRALAQIYRAARARCRGCGAHARIRSAVH